MQDFKVSVCIATTGRPAILIATLTHVLNQTRLPDSISICSTKPADLDLDALASLPYSFNLLTSKPSLTLQRNTLLDAETTTDIVLFIDDDFLLAPNYIEEACKLFADNPDCVMATGLVIADGATGPGIDIERGEHLLAEYRKISRQVAPIFNAYGCNMALRWSALRAHHCRFDETLLLYAWLEDVDFSRQAAAFGRILKGDAMVGVHLGTKLGKVSGKRFGYSQIANQAYLAKKGTMPIWRALRKTSENILANMYGLIRNNEAFIDRRGRLIGNCLGLRHMILGTISPTRILEL